MIKEYKSGLKLVITEMKGYDSTTINICVGTGSINETEDNYGISHFIEHMMFKGTKKRTAQDIAREFDAVGASVNAATSQTKTVYYAKSTAENLEKCTEVLSDMLTNSVFDEKEMKREKKVVCEEISMYNDNPSAVVSILSNEKLFANSVYEHDIAGSKKIVKSITRNQIIQYINQYYVPSNIVISIAGKITENQAIKLIEKYFVTYIENENSKYKQPKFCVPALKQIYELKQYKNNEQSFITIDYRSITYQDKDIFALSVLNVILGVGMSSRLFSVVREKYGLVYNISSDFYISQDCGAFGIEFATLSKNVPLAISKVYEVISDITKNGVKDKEFVDAKNCLIAQLKLTLENTMAVASKTAKDIFDYGKVFSKEDRIKMINDVSIEQINKFCKNLFENKPYIIAMVGKNTRQNLLEFYK